MMSESLQDVRLKTNETKICNSLFKLERSMTTQLIDHNKKLIEINNTLTQLDNIINYLEPIVKSNSHVVVKQTGMSLATAVGRKQLAEKILDIIKKSK